MLRSVCECYRVCVSVTECVCVCECYGVCVSATECV